MVAEVQDAVISLQRLELAEAHVEIEGTNPLIVHAWSEKARKDMLNKQQSKASPKVNKDPKKDFETSMYRFPDGGHGFPTLGFKAATVKGGARAFGKSIKMVDLRQSLLFVPDGICTDTTTPLTRLECDEPRMREDMVRLNGKTADIRYRAHYENWRTVLTIRYLPNIIDLGSITALIDAAGYNGVGEWRPEKSGTFGTFRVVTI